MKIVVAMDSFKGGLSAPAACRAVARGLKEVQATTNVVLKPMADGGEGTASALLGARPGGEWIALRVAGPIPGRAIDAGFAFWPEDGTALVELAVASGLPLLEASERNPLRTSTYGTGELIRAAAERGARRILLALGGSATVDGGIGAASALGWRFLDEQGESVPPWGGNLSNIARILPPPEPTHLPPLTVLCDVDNPLCGPDGAAVVYGPQKGATPAMVPLLDKGLAHLAMRIREDIGRDVADLPGAGAAGGMAAGAVAFFDARIEPGIELIFEACGLRAALRCADACITGEGSFDAQSLRGKVVSGVARIAAEAGVPVTVIAGRVTVRTEEYRKAGIHEALATHDPDMPMEEVIRNEDGLIRETAAQWMQSRQHSTTGQPTTGCA